MTNIAALKPLDHYGMSAERGFLCQFNPEDVALPEPLASAQALALRLPKLLPSGRVRTLLEGRLPSSVTERDIANLTDAQARLAMVHYSFMIQSYVWGEANAPTIIPRVLAQPMAWLGDKVGQPPLLPYSSYVLDNWGQLDASRPIDLDNIYMIQHFLGGQDEAWFVLIHVAIEARAGAILARFGDIIKAAHAGNAHAAQTQLTAMIPDWGQLNDIFARMPERCDPYVYFERVRPYIHGWRDNPALPNGLIYEGVDKFAGQPQAFRGQTGSQSSIVPSMDALLGVGHADDPLKAYLDQLHIYRPPGHRRFIDDVRASSTLRGFVEREGSPALDAAYNGVVQAVADFRSRHLEYAASYISKQARGGAGNDPDVGTGGTPFMKYLKKHRDETQARLIRA